MKAAEEVLDKRLKESGIRMGWMPIVKQTILVAMEEYASQYSGYTAPQESPQYENDGESEGDTVNKKD